MFKPEATAHTETTKLHVCFSMSSDEMCYFSFIVKLCAEGIMLSTRYLLCVEGRKVPDGDAVQWSWPNLLADGFFFLTELSQWVKVNGILTRSCFTMLP